MGVMIPALMIGSVSGNYINPAFVIGMASVGSLAWGKALLFIVVEFLGAMAGQLVVVAMHKPYYDKTTNPTAILVHSQLLKIREVSSTASSANSSVVSCFSSVR